MRSSERVATCAGRSTTTKRSRISVFFLASLLILLYLGSSCFNFTSSAYGTTSISGPRAQGAQQAIPWREKGSATASINSSSSSLQQNQTSSSTILNFGAVLQTASYDHELSNPPLVVNADLKMLESSGISSIRIDVGYDPWLSSNLAAISQMNATIRSVKSDGMKLIIADAAAESYRHGGQIPWDRFQAAWIQRVSTLASLYHPDYYVVIKEPGWYVDMVSDSRTNPEFQSVDSWLSLTNKLASAVLSVSPNTRVGVAVASDSLGSNPELYVPYLLGVEKMTTISFIGFDIYSPSGLTSTAAFLNAHGSGGKGVWIAETWSTDGSTALDPSRAQIDASWIQHVCAFAQGSANASMIIPFYTNDFAGYYPSTAIPGPSFFSAREPAYYAYKSIIQSV